MNNTITRKKYRWNYKKFFSRLFTLIIITLYAWLILSYLDIVFNNLSGGTDAEWNLLKILYKKALYM